MPSLHTLLIRVIFLSSDPDRMLRTDCLNTSTPSCTLTGQKQRNGTAAQQHNGGKDTKKAKTFSTGYLRHAYADRYIQLPGHEHDRGDDDRGDDATPEQSGTFLRNPRPPQDTRGDR